MEENIYEHTPAQEKKQIVINETDKAIVASSCRWAKFLAILGFIGVGLSVLIFLMLLLGILVAGITIPGMTDPMLTMTMVITLILAIFVMLIYFLPLFYLYRYASKGLEAVGTDDGALMTESLLNLKRHFKFIGIFTIVLMVFYVLSFVVTMMGMFSGATGI